MVMQSSPSDICDAIDNDVFVLIVQDSSNHPRCTPTDAYRPGMAYWLYKIPTSRLKDQQFSRKRCDEDDITIRSPPSLPSDHQQSTIAVIKINIIITIINVAKNHNMLAITMYNTLTDYRTGRSDLPESTEQEQATKTGRRLFSQNNHRACPPQPLRPSRVMHGATPTPTPAYTARTDDLHRSFKLL